MLTRLPSLRVLAAGVAMAIIGVACNIVEPVCACEPVPPTFDGTIVSRSKVIDTFAGTSDYTLVVDQDPEHANPNDPCADIANVHLSKTTVIRYSDSPDATVDPELLVPPKAVRVMPGEPTGTGCQRKIEATMVTVVR